MAQHIDHDAPAPSEAEYDRMTFEERDEVDAVQAEQALATLLGDRYRPGVKR